MLNFETYMLVCCIQISIRHSPEILAERKAIDEKMKERKQKKSHEERVNKRNALTQESRDETEL